MALISLPPDLMRRVDSFDALVDARVESMRGNKPADLLFYGLSQAGDFSVIWHLLGWGSALRNRQLLRSAAHLSMALGVESALVNGLIKSLFRRERPDWDQNRPRHLRQPKSSSFPSGHASSAFMAARLLGRTVGHPVALHGLAALVAYSRSHVRIHHASDVAGGIVTGALLGQVATKVFDRLKL